MGSGLGMYMSVVCYFFDIKLKIVVIVIITAVAMVVGNPCLALVEIQWQPG